MRWLRCFFFLGCALRVCVFLNVEERHLHQRRYLAATAPSAAVIVSSPFLESVPPPPPSHPDYHHHYYLDQPSNDTKVNKWQNNVVHVIQMRLMQLQPNLLDLGRARIDLFRTITLPSLVQQTCQDFLLIIRTDPDLHPVLKEDFLATIRHVPNAVVVASNKLNMGFREMGMDDIKETTIMSGSYALVQDYHQAAQTHVVLETRLDADDALSLNFVESIQRQAHHVWLENKNNDHADDPRTVAAADWRVWCLGPHMNWHFYNPWDSTKSTTTGGSLIPMYSKECLTAGLTYGFQVNATLKDVPERQHHKMHKRIPTCQEKKRPMKCLERGTGGLAAFRGRTPTSAGMKGVVNQATGGATTYSGAADEKSQSQYWVDVQRIFGLNAISIETMRRRLESNLPAIVQDAIKGQCTKGHSCKKESMEALHGLLKNTGTNTT